MFQYFFFLSQCPESAFMHLSFRVRYFLSSVPFIQWEESIPAPFLPVFIIIFLILNLIQLLPYKPILGSNIFYFLSIFSLSGFPFLLLPLPVINVSFISSPTPLYRTTPYPAQWASGRGEGWQPLLCSFDTRGQQKRLHVQCPIPGDTHHSGKGTHHSDCNPMWVLFSIRWQ